MKSIKKILFVALGLWCLLGSVGCKTDKPGGEGDPDSVDSLQEKGPLFTLAMSGGDTAVYDTKRLYKAASDSASSNSEGVTQIVISYPKFESTPYEKLSDSLNQIIRKLLLLNSAGDLAFKSIQQRLDDFINEFIEDQEFMAEMGLGGASVWESRVNISVMLNSPNFLVLRFYEMNFAGGAHANYRVKYYNFDMNTGKELELEDLFVEGYEAPLLKMAENSFRTKAGLNPSTPLIETDFEFEGGEFHLPENYALTPTGILFYYNSYELLPHQNFEFELLYDDVVNYIDRAILK